MKIRILLIASCLALVRANGKATKSDGTREARQYDEPYSDNYGGMPYSFSYSVYDPNYYNDYGHYESSDGRVVRGGYRVALPDGRLQVVNYHVEGDSGYVAHVKYQGEAHYPEYKPSYDGSGYQPKPEYFHKPEYAHRPDVPEHAHPAYKTDYPLPPNYQPYVKEAEHPSYHDHSHDHDHGHAHDGYTKHYPHTPQEAYNKYPAAPHEGYTKYPAAPHEGHSRYPAVPHEDYSKYPAPQDGYNKYPHDGYSKRPDVSHPEPYHPAPYREPAAEPPVTVTPAVHEPPRSEPHQEVHHHHPEHDHSEHNHPEHHHSEHHHPEHHHPEHHHTDHHHPEHKEPPRYQPERPEPPRYEPETQYHAYPGHYNHDHHHHDRPHAHDGYTPHTPHYEDHGNHYHAHGHDDPYPKTYVHYEQPPSHQTGTYEPPKIKLIDVGENFNPYGYTASSSKRSVRPPAIIYVRKAM